MSYKIGDKVRIINNLEEGNFYNSPEEVVDDMLKYAGEYAEIIGDYGNGTYELSCDGGDWRWPEKTLVPYPKTNGDRIRNMTDEELSWFLMNFQNSFGVELLGKRSCLNWLKEDIEK